MTVPNMAVGANPERARLCARPGCATPAGATLHFHYPERRSWIAPLEEDPAPQAYDLCHAHAARSRPPSGWAHEERRPTAGRGERQEPAQGPGGEDADDTLPRQLALPAERW